MQIFLPQSSIHADIEQIKKIKKISEKVQLLVFSWHNFVSVGSALPSCGAAIVYSACNA